MAETDSALTLLRDSLRRFVEREIVPKAYA